MANRLAEYSTPSSSPASQWPTPSSGQMMNFDDIQEQLGSYLHKATEWIKQHPEIALTSAVVTGAVLAWFIKRR